MKKFGSRLILGGIDVAPYFHDAEMLGVLGGRERESRDEGWAGLVPLGHFSTTYQIGPYNILPDCMVGIEGDQTEVGGVAVLTERATGREICTAAFTTLHRFVNDRQRQQAQRFMKHVLCLADDEGVTLRAGHDGTETADADVADQWHVERHFHLGGLDSQTTIRHRDNRDVLEVDGKVVIEITHYPTEGIVVAKSRDAEMPFIYLGRRFSTHWVEVIMNASAPGTTQADWITRNLDRSSFVVDAPRSALGADSIITSLIEYK